eukprot:TRINITY_DN668_c0_g1_i10.p1 TRINITY_DN668_c0_g1~~TRINITY_DN668_c0_g1_i10.p1  ORF type:complete len:346 (-),score=72.87 TRINITY_DN668_c0_g1_i10:210-1247(-)
MAPSLILLTFCALVNFATSGESAKLSGEDKISNILKSGGTLTLRENVLLTKALPIVDPLKGVTIVGNCRSNNKSVRCIIDGAGKFPFIVSNSTNQYEPQRPMVLDHVQVQRMYGGVVVGPLNVNLANSIFINNTSPQAAAVVQSADLYYESFIVNISNCEFINNIAQQGAGAVVNQPLAAPSSFTYITNSKFEGNAALSGNGGALSIAGTLGISGSTFTKNRAKGDGGALWFLGYSASLSINNTSFSSNTAQGQGAAMALNPTSYPKSNVEDPLTAVFCNVTVEGKAAGLQVYLGPFQIGRSNKLKYEGVLRNCSKKLLFSQISIGKSNYTGGPAWQVTTKPCRC